MTQPVSPGPFEPIVETDDKGRMQPEGLMSQPWYLYMQDLQSGDSGTAWTPIATNLTFAGAAPTITGYYYQNQGFVDFWIQIVPGTSTTSTANVTYFDLPFNVDVDSYCAVGGQPGLIGLITASTKRCYPPPYAGNTSTLTITGRVVSQ